MPIKEQELLDFITHYTGLDLSMEDDIHIKGLVGDDFFDLMEVYSQKYKVDMSNFLWYFHNMEEGHNIGSLFFKTPNQRVKRIPVTAKMLLGFINTNKWDIDYPLHFMPKKRWDIIFNRVFFCILAAFFAILLFMKLNISNTG